MDVTLPSGQVIKGVPDNITKSQLVQKLQANGLEVPQSWLPQQQPDDGQYAGAGGFNPMLARIGGASEAIANKIGIQGDPDSMANAFAPAETAAHLATGAVATPIAGLAGLGASVIPGVDAAAVVNKVQEFLTYKPRTAAGQAMTNVVTSPLQAAAHLTNAAGEKTAEITGSPALGAAVKTAGDIIPAALLARGAAGETSAARVPVKPQLNPVEAAQNYARARGLDWDSLSDTFKAQLTKVASSAENLANLPAQAIERQGLLESLPVPVKGTRGKLTRDPVELRNEGNVSATEAGKPIRAMDVAANDALLQNLEVLKQSSTRGRGKADSPEQVGSSLQGAARAKLAEQKAKVTRLYKEAETRGQLEAKVSPKPLLDLIQNTPDKVHFGWVESWMNDIGVRQSGAINKLSLKELEDLRQSAVARAMDGGTEAHYAGKIIGAIDKATEGAGGAAYQAARKARRDQATEFEEQAGVAKLVENKSRTDRATALEDTWRKTVLGGSIDDLSRVKKSLLTGTSETKKAGIQAWRDLRAQTVQHIINEATKSVTRFENGSPNLTPASMERAIKAIGKDKLAQIFDKKTVETLDKIMEATRIVKTEPPPGFKGSPTFANAITFLEGAIGKVPIIGNTTVGAVRAVAQLNQLGKGGRVSDRALTTPLDDAVKKAK